MIFTKPITGLKVGRLKDMRYSYTKNGTMPQLDITKPELGVEIQIDQRRKVLYVHVDGVTVLRICRFPNCEVSQIMESDIVSNKSKG